MDPLTHGLVGVALSAFSGDAVSIQSSISIGAMLGAMSPDLDFVIRIFKNDAAYLEHHRGVSHSVPFLIGFSVAITGILSLIGFQNFSFLSTLIWTFIGALSHTGLDILNSYGAKLFRKKVKLSLLTLYDPVITIVGLAFIINGKNSLYQLASGVLIILIYLLMRNYSRHKASIKLFAFFTQNYSNVKIYVNPSLKAFYKWDFIAHTTTHDLVGQYNPWMQLINKERCIKIQRVLVIEDHKFQELFKSSTVGEIFSNFSPNLHIMTIKDTNTNQLVLRAIDLRYYIKKNFMHHATLILDSNMNFVSSELHPYRLNKRVPVYQ